VAIGNPLKTKSIAEAKIKTDKVDAEVLAQLLRCEYLPLVWQPDSPAQVQRALLTHRTSLMTRRCRHKNRVQAVLARLILPAPCKYLWSKKGLQWLTSLELSATDRLILDSNLRQLEQVEQELEIVDRQLVEIAHNEPRVRLLMTLPGVSHVVAVGLLSALGEIERFRDGDHAASYLGLVPSTKQSGGKCYHGRITKAENPQARWLLIQACQHVSRHPGPLGAFYRRLVRRKPRQVAIMALARKLVTIAWLMLTHHEPYRYAKPLLTAKKFATLKRQYRPQLTEAVSKRGPRTSSGLAAVYAEQDLPACLTPEELPRGERQMLLDHEVLEFVEELYRSKPAAKKR